MSKKVQIEQGEYLWVYGGHTIRYSSWINIYHIIAPYKLPVDDFEMQLFQSSKDYSDDGMTIYLF